MPIMPQDLLKLFLAILVGGLIGVEREFRHKAAGFRTNIFICVGATLFTIFAEKFSNVSDATRIVANIVSGVGFIGAGVILRDEGRVIGLTTAAIIWLTAALGMGIGAGQYLLVGAATGVVVFILWIFPRFEKRIDQFNEGHNYEITSSLKCDKFRQVEAALRECGLQVRNHKRMKRGDKLIGTWDVWGSLAGHEQFVDKLLADQEIEEFHF
jgi:putative Mg2+ transporter-C (MgtC) family protein